MRILMMMWLGWLMVLMPHQPTDKNNEKGKTE
jgi:hypothetical protein